MDSLRSALHDLVKESKDLVDRCLAVIIASSESVSSERVALEVAHALEEDPALRLIPTFCLIDALSLLMVRDHNTVSAEVLSVLFRSGLALASIVSRASKDMSEGTKNKARGYLKRWHTRKILDASTWEALLECVNGKEPPATMPSLAGPSSSLTEEERSNDATTPSSAQGVTAVVAEATTIILKEVLEILRRLPEDHSIKFAQALRTAQLSSVQVNLSNPSAATVSWLEEAWERLRKEETAHIARLNSARGSMGADAAAEEDDDDDREASGADHDFSSPRRNPSPQHIVAASYLVKYLSPLQTDCNSDAMGSSSYTAAVSRKDLSYPYTHPREPSTQRRPFRWSGQNRTAYRCWGMNEEQWAVERDLARLITTKLRDVQDGIASLSNKRQREERGDEQLNLT